MLRVGPIVLVVALLVAGCTNSATVESAADDAKAHAPPPLPIIHVDPPVDAPEAATSLPPAPDPTAAGPFAFTRIEYQFGERPFVNPNEPSVYPTRLRGSIHLPEGDGPFPIVLLQHGRHATCAPAAGPELLVPGGARCPDTPVVTPIDSHEGYDHVGENLASHGFAVVSVDAGDVNDLDGAFFAFPNADAGAAARAHILLETLDELARRNAGEGDDGTLEGKLDLTRIGLMGHSRGGEGVTYAIHANAARPESQRHAILAVFALAPIDRTRVKAEGVHWATLLPYCDGDVWTLSGARFYDDSRAVDDGLRRTQLLVMGANHNYYNTRWTYDDARFGDDEGDPACGQNAPRPTADEQRLQGVALLGAFFRLHLAGETAFAPLFDGRAGLPASACHAAIPCADQLHVSTVGPRRHVVRQVPAAGEARGVEIKTCAPPECPGAFAVGSAERAIVSWTKPGAIELPLEGAFDASGYLALTFRVGIDGSDKRNTGIERHDVRVVLVDATNKTASVDAGALSRALFASPGGEAFQRVVLNDVRLPLAAFPGVDMTRLTGIRLEFGATPRGAVHLADVLFQG